MPKQNTTTTKKVGFYRKENSNNSALSNATSMEPRMLPPQFRKRSYWLQRLFLISIVMLYSIFFGVFGYTIMNGVRENFNISTSNEQIYFLIITVVPVITLLQVCYYQVFSRTKAYIINKNDFFSYLFPPLSFIILLGVVNNMHDSSLHTYIDIMSYGNMGIAFIPMIMILIKNIALRKKYHKAKFRSASSIPGLILSGISILMFNQLGNGADNSSIDLQAILALVGFSIGGIIIQLIGISFASKYAITSSQHLWSGIRFTAGLPTIMVYTMLLSLSFTFAISGVVDKIIVLPIIIDILLLSSLTSYLFWRGRIKNIHKTNPLLNQIFIKGFIGIVALTGFIVIALLPAISHVKSFGPTSFAIQAITSSTIIIGVLISYFMNFITFSKYFKTTMAGMAIALFSIVIIILVIGATKNGSQIMEILSRQLNILFLSITIIIEMGILGADITYLLLDNAKNKKSKLLKQEEKQRRVNKLKDGADIPSVEDNTKQKNRKLRKGSA